MEFPSLRYASTTDPSSSILRKSGPLKLSLGCEKNYNAKNNSAVQMDDRRGKSGSAALSGEAPPARRVHFAELPPKINSYIDLSEFKRKNEKSAEVKEEAENWLRNTVGISCIDVRSVSSSRFVRPGLPSFSNISTSFKINSFRLGNNGEVNGGGVRQVARNHDTVKYHRGMLTQSEVPAILKAAKDGDDEEISEILRKASVYGISSEELNAADSSGRTSLSYIASNGALANLKAILQFSKIDVNKKDNEGNTPLHFASQAGQVEAINYMLSICPNLEVDARNSLGFTPLMKAALQGRTKCAKLLLFAGASPNLRDSGRGLKAEQWAKFCGRYVCAEVIEKFSKEKTESNASFENWGSEPELSESNSSKQIATRSGIKSRLRKAFRNISTPGAENPDKLYSVVSRLGSATLCASSPVLQSNVSSSIRSLLKPPSVPKVKVTLAPNNPIGDSGYSYIHSSTTPMVKEKLTAFSSSTRGKKKK